MPYWSQGHPFWSLQGDPGHHLGPHGPGASQIIKRIPFLDSILWYLWEPEICCFFNAVQTAFFEGLGPLWEPKRKPQGLKRELNLNQKASSCQIEKT